MLSGLQAVFVGGDARQLEVIRKFAELDASIILVGYETIQNQFSGMVRTRLSPELLKTASALILPAVGTDDQGNVESIFSSETLQIKEEHIAALPKQAKVFTGMAKPYLRRLCDQYSIQLIELFERDDIAIYNSIPTAEGALMMAIQNTDITIHSSECMVLGFGRTGITMARALQGLGAKVRVGVRRPEQYARVWEMGFNPFYCNDLIHHIHDIDLIFNTIPTMIITAQIIANLPHRTVIIDLASKPGGTDFRFAEKRGIKALLAPGLPGIVAPKTAGRIIADTLSQLLMEDGDTGRIT